MITLKEIISSSDYDELCLKKQYDIIDNIDLLLERVNAFRLAYGKPLRVTSGFRSMKKHLAIYKAKGIVDTKSIPMQSNHLYGLACDVAPIEDNIFHLQSWIFNNINLCEEIGLWFEDFDYTKQWCHVQVVPFGSWKQGKSRFFIP